MKFAIVNGERLEALSGIQGSCTGCGNPTIAKCGAVKVHHWAHQSKTDCDAWWENETVWHRNWKKHFPVTWQEVVQRAHNGEFHRADVKTSRGWVLEFQYSAINCDERASRNDFYEKLVWIVHGSRRKKDPDQFFRCLKVVNTVDDPFFRRVCDVTSNKSALLREWTNETSPVLFDFEEPKVLWCLLPSNVGAKAIVVEVVRERFIELHLSDPALAQDIFDQTIRAAAGASSAEDVFLKFHYLRRDEERRRQLLAEDVRRRNPYRNQRVGRRF